MPLLLYIDTAREGKLITVAAAGTRARRQEHSSSIRSISDPLIYSFISLNQITELCEDILARP